MAFYPRRGKRILDLVLTVPICIFLSPFMAMIAVFIWVELGRPILFSQARPGIDGKSFVLRKFRTMSNRSDCRGQLLPDAERLSRMGKILRHLSLDELPTFLNVVKGEMSLVGPRPLLMKYLPRYTPFQMRRHEVKPGITGWAQIKGRNAISWNEKFAYDVWYVDHVSFWQDLKIIIMTMEKVFKREGISQAGHATMEEFLGSEKR